MNRKQALKLREDQVVLVRGTVNSVEREDGRVFIDVQFDGYSLDFLPKDVMPARKRKA